MTFKIDWDAIKNQTPEQRKIERAIEDKNRLDCLMVLITQRTEMVGVLESKTHQLSEKDNKFISDLKYKATTFGRIQGVQGEDLGFLSEKQVSYLEGLYARFVKKSVDHIAAEAGSNVVGKLKIEGKEREMNDMDVAIANTRETKRLFSKGDVDGAFAHYMQDPFGGKNPEFAQTTKDEFVFSMQCQAGGPKAALYLTPLERQAWCEAGADDAAIEMIADAGGFDSVRVDGRKLSSYQNLLHGPLNSRIQGIHHELTKLGWESDHDALLRKVIDGVELQVKLVRSFINAGKLVSDFKFDVIDVSGGVYVTSVVDNDMKKSMSAMAQSVNGVACELSAKAKAPMAQANKIAGEKAEVWYADETVGGTYTGKVMGLSAEHVVLSLGRSALVVWQSRIDQVPAKGDDVTIAFKDGQGVVSFNRAVEKSENER